MSQRSTRISQRVQNLHPVGRFKILGTIPRMVSKRVLGASLSGRGIDANNPKVYGCKAVSYTHLRAHET